MSARRCSANTMDIIRVFQLENESNKSGREAITSYEITTFHSHHVISKLQTKHISLNGHPVEIVDTNALEQLILTDSDFKDAVDDSNTLSKIISHSDLVEGIYEGGLKVWECGVDLANFIASETDSCVQVQGKTVLELGCGAGIPGVFCALRGAARVDFQDYNAEVLKLLTQPNVEKNTHAGTDSACAETEFHYFAGDWSSFAQLECLTNVEYDVILSAETIYNVANYAKLHTIFDKLLAQNGQVLLAAKSYYFGVGGSIEAFVEYVRSHKCFSIEVVHTITKGVLRKILRLERQKKGPSEDVP